MIITVELSLYPLDNRYKGLVEEFILHFKEANNFKVLTNGMSTTIIGDISLLMPALQSHFKEYLDQNEGIFVMKLGKGELLAENLPDSLL